jgi:hypothetical protein
VIRQLLRLARPLPAAGPGALALAVYAVALDGSFVAAAAADQGFEGVACVDDAARGVDLFAAAWRRHPLPWIRQMAEGLLQFVRYQQDEQGRFANFVLDWEGHPNRTGPSSYPGGAAWQARAMHALATARLAFGSDDELETAFARGLPWLDEVQPYLDIRALHALTALAYWRATADPALAERAVTWAEEIAASRIGDLLPDLAEQSTVHLWGHLQEAALASIGLAFDRPDLIERARASIEIVFVPAVERAFRDRFTTIAFDLSCAVRALDAVAAATGEPRYARLAADARAWFSGRNAINQPVYDHDRGLVHDGLDGQQLNPDSGAESNLEAALALLDMLPWSAVAWAQYSEQWQARWRTALQSPRDLEALLRRTYAAFNARDLDAVIAVMHPDVDWPNAWEGGRLQGRAAVRSYWARQFEVIDARVDPRAFAFAPDGRVVTDVHQVVRDRAGAVISDRSVQHVYRLRDGLIEQMEVREA